MNQSASETRFRILSALIAIPTVLVFVFVDFGLVDLVFYLIALYLLGREFNEFNNLKSSEISFSLSFILITGGLQLFYLHTPGKKDFNSLDQILIVMMTLQLFLFFFINMFKSEFDQKFQKIQSFTFTLFFTVFFSSFFLKLKYISTQMTSPLPDLTHPLLDNYFLLYAILTAWVYDSFAFFSGKFLGKKKLGIQVSPNKTWIGLITGILFTPLAYFFVILLIKVFSPNLHHPFFTDYLQGVMMSFALAIIGQYGDLLASLIKRSVGIKNSGVFLKGHGGFFDRIDSLIPTVLFFYFFLVLYY